MTYGLTPEGFFGKTFEVITSELKERLTENLGQLNFDDNTVIANLVNIFAEREVYIWQLCQSLYDSMSPSAASGLSLDNNCALLGIKRLGATYSYVTAQLYGNNYTTIPAGSLAKIKNSNSNFSLFAEVKLNNELCKGISLRITDPSKTQYTLTINGITLTYIIVMGDTADKIAEKLAELVNAQQQFSQLLTASHANDTVNIQSLNYKNDFSCFISEGITIPYVTNNGLFISVNTGVIPVPVNSLTDIVSLVNGWLSVGNIDQGVTGRDLETDNELRLRRRSLLMLPGRGTLDALRAKMLTLKEVTAALVEENTANQTQGTMPPHSFLVTINGGSDNDIAQTIWDYKPVGIESIGNISISVKDIAGNTNIVKFNRAGKVYAFIDITITKNADFNNLSAPLIKTEIIEYVLSLKLGESLIYQKLYGIIYAHPGVVTVTIVLGGSTDPNVIPPKSASNINIDKHQILTTDEGKINLTIQ